MKPARRNSPAVILLLISLSCLACTREKTPEEVLVKVYVENIIAAEIYSGNIDSLRVHKELVFRKYKVTEKEFEAELEKYSDDKAKWAKFFEKASKYLDDLKKSRAIK